MFGDCVSNSASPFSPAQLVQPATSLAALADCCMHADRHALLSSVIIAKRLLDDSYYNKRVRPLTFSVGDLVFVFDFEKAQAYKRKLAPPSVGLGKIVRQVVLKFLTSFSLQDVGYVTSMLIV